MSDELKHKMYDYEVNPPEAVWDSIAGELEEDAALNPLREKMQAYKVMPPKAAWRNIVAALKKETPVKNIAFKKIYQWSAAAAVILSVGAYYLLNYSHTGKVIHDKNTLVNNANETEQTSSNSYSHVIANKEDLASAVKHIAADRFSRRKMYDYEDARILPLSYVEDAEPIIDEEAASVTPRPILAASGELIQDKSVVNPNNDEYISVTAPNGQQTKISSRFINAMPYFNTNNSDKMEASENSWQQRIHEWRKKILQSAFVPSSGNFMDILEMTELVDEDEKKQ